MKNNSQLINQDSGNVEWCTPWAIIECARKLMGSIDLDPFSCFLANHRPEGKIATHYYDERCDSFGREWLGNVWMNHPFGREYNEKAIAKIVHEHTRSNPSMDQACCITFSSTSEKWFKPLMYYPQFFFTGRTNYINGETMQPIKGVPKGSVITFFPPRGESYHEGLRKLDHIFSSKFDGVAK